MPRAHGIVRVGLALGLPAIDALVADGRSVGLLRYCLTHQKLLIAVEPDTIHRWRAAHSDCVPGARTWRCISDGYRSCSGLWVTSPELVPVATTPADALHEALSQARGRMRAPAPQRREPCFA
ncbi:hypothetical protein [Streptomyces chartreusis]|uniref:hypothetical protein n=1 Tax=Streptomyces chartreusis TaxID=1969 RepID=UPI0033EEFEC3